MNRLYIIFGFSLISLFLSSGNADAQLITDSEKRKLETRPTEGRGFLQGIFKKKIKSSSGPVFDGRVSRSSRGPSSSPFVSFNQRKRATPHSSEGISSQKYRSRGAPSISAGISSQKYRSRGAPSISAGIASSLGGKRSTPRYSKGDPFGRGLVAEIFHLSKGPRTSRGMPFKPNQLTAANPKYSVGNPFGDMDFRKSPKYSKGSPYEGMNWNWIKPRYSTNKHRFDVDETYKKQTRIYDFAASGYKGNSRSSSKWYSDLNDRSFAKKLSSYTSSNRYTHGKPMPFSGSGQITPVYKQKWIHNKEAHPSYKYHNGFQDSEYVRSSLRKWNLFLTRVDRNKDQPDAVTDKISKPKFDRKEAEIWND